MEIEGTVERILSFDTASGYMVFLIKSVSDSELKKYENNQGLIKCCGLFCIDQKKLPVRLIGEFQEKTSYGIQFNVNKVELFSSNMNNTEQFITELNLKLNRRQIRRILDVTTPDVFTACMDENKVFELQKASGADEMSVYDFVGNIKNFVNELKLFELLISQGGTYDECLKIMKAYPDDPVEALNEEPYEIPKKAGISFRTCDKIALSNGFEKLCETRINAILLYCMHTLKNTGHVYATFEQIVKIANKSFGEMPRTFLLSKLENHPYIVKDKKYDIFYEKGTLKEEKDAAHNFARIEQFKKVLPWHPEYIQKIEQEQGYEFGSEQREAFNLLKSTGFKLLTGDPGTGKTSTLKGLLRYLEMLWEEEYKKKPEFALCAPSGRAAQRMKETTGRLSQTIHKLIEYQPYGDSVYCRDASDPLTADVVVVDETSMMGLSIFDKLIGAIQNGAMVLLIGDTNQLQSVEAGDVLQDIISCGYVDSCHLTETFRQGVDSYICENARKIIRGDQNLLNGSDFEVIECTTEQTPQILQEKVSELMCSVPADSIQVLSPMRAGTCGVTEGNKILQTLINPKQEKGLKYGKKNYHVGDRVIMTSNNYALNYFNGDVGYITRLGESSVCIQIGDDEIVLPKTQFSDMDLAYVTTIHKSQGSEYDYVIIVLQQKAACMLTRNLLYTAVTRGKRKVIVIAEPDTIEKAVNTNRTDDRNSLLYERIQTEVEKRKGKKEEKVA